MFKFHSMCANHCPELPLVPKLSPPDFCTQGLTQFVDSWPDAQGRGVRLTKTGGEALGSKKTSSGLTEGSVDALLRGRPVRGCIGFWGLGLRSRIRVNTGGRGSGAYHLVRLAAISEGGSARGGVATGGDTGSIRHLSVAVLAGQNSECFAGVVDLLLGRAGGGARVAIAGGEGRLQGVRVERGGGCG